VKDLLEGIECDPITRAWVRNASDVAAVRAGCFFDLAAAEYVRDFLQSMLMLPPTQAEQERLLAAGEKIEAKPFRVLDWQWLYVIAPLFGWKRKNGFRRFRRGYLSIAKKNGKTGLAAALSIFMLTGDGEPSPEIYTVAGSRDQASICYGDVATMVKVSPKIQDALTDLESKREIRCNLETGGEYAALASDASNNEGYKPHFTVYDELHTAKGRKLFDAMLYGGASRPQSLLLTITTAGDGADAEHICREQYDYAKNIIKGLAIDIQFFACIFEAPEKCELDDVEAIKAANPSVGETIDLDEVLAAANEAKITPGGEARFRRYRLNQWVSNAEAWLTDLLWIALPADLTIDELAGCDGFGGLDLSSTDDLSAFSILIPPKDPERGIFDLWVRFYCPEDNIIQLEQKHRVSYTAWRRDGWIKALPGSVIDYPQIRRDVMSYAETINLVKLGIDRGFQGQETESALITAFSELPKYAGKEVVHPVGAGWVSQSEPIKFIEKLVKSKRLRHNGSPVLRWNALNAVVKKDEKDGFSLTKNKRRAKIDGIAATVSAVHCYLFTRAPKKSVYEGRGIRVF
jgi:phage terminase large subunit-like protein